MSYKNKYLKYKNKYNNLQHGGYNISNIDDGLLYGEIDHPPIIKDQTVRAFMSECGINDMLSYAYIYVNSQEDQITAEMLDNKMSTLQGYETDEKNDILFIDNTFTRIMRGHQNGGIFFKGNKILKISSGERLKAKLDNVPKEILDIYPKKYEMKKSFILMEKFDYDLTDYFFTYLPMELIKTKFDNNEFLINAWNNSNEKTKNYQQSDPITPTTLELELLMDFTHSLIDMYRTYGYKFWFDTLIFLKMMRKYDYANMDLKWDNLAVDSNHRLRFIDEDSGLIKAYNSEYVIEIGQYMNKFTEAVVFDMFPMSEFPIFTEYRLKQYKIGDMINLIPQSLEGLENYKIIKIINSQSLGDNNSNCVIDHIKWQNYHGRRVIFTIFINKDTVEIEHNNPASLGLLYGSKNRSHDLTIIEPMIQDILKSSEIRGYNGNIIHRLKLTNWKHVFGRDVQDVVWIDEPKPYGNTTISKIEGNIATMLNGGKFELPELSKGGYHINFEWPSNDLKLE